MPRATTVATCVLAQWALDFTGNLERILRSIQQAKIQQARYRIGPELEVCGYGCEDHFYESDTFIHSWEVIKEIVSCDITDGILCDIGMPVAFEGVRYNCRILILNRKILMVRPKMFLADDGNYRESRWFTAWTRGYQFNTLILPHIIREVTGQESTLIGVGGLALSDTIIGSETCEELFTPDNPGIALGLGGVEIFGNGSGSHHTLGKLSRRLELICETTRKNGGLYLYSNQQGCDGSRLYFDGAALIVLNGEVIAQGTQFSMKEVDVVVATIDLNDVINYRTAIVSRGVQAAVRPQLPLIHADWSLCTDQKGARFAVPTRLSLLSPEDEIASGPSCWLWDYLRRSGMRGFFLPLSGGTDSSAIAAIVAFMCRSLYRMVTSCEDLVERSLALSQLRRCVGDENFFPQSAKDVAKNLLFCCFMSAETSSLESQRRAAELASNIGANFVAADIRPMIRGVMDAWESIGPALSANDGVIPLRTRQRAVHHVEARSRMVFSYLCSAMMPWAKGCGGKLLVLGSSNLDEALRGYVVKYGCSSADLNPIGSLSTVMIRRFLLWAAGNGLPALFDVLRVDVGELQRDGERRIPYDEVMGLTRDEIEECGRLRKIFQCGPLSMYLKLVRTWNAPQETAAKVKLFFKFYSINRHKMTVATPSYHMENYNPDDNRYDMRQVLYRDTWDWQFNAIDREVEKAKFPP